MRKYVATVTFGGTHAGLVAAHVAVAIIAGLSHVNERYVATYLILALGIVSKIKSMTTDDLLPYKMSFVFMSTLARAARVSLIHGGWFQSSNGITPYSVFAFVMAEVQL